MSHRITKEITAAYIVYLEQEERSGSTIEKYQKEINAFRAMLPSDWVFSKETVLEWKRNISSVYAASTVNAKLAALNGLFAYAGWHECRVKPVSSKRACSVHGSGS